MVVESNSCYREKSFMDSRVLEKRVRYILGFFIFALVISGLTAIPIRWEIGVLQRFIGEGTFMEKVYPSMALWISFVHHGLADIPEDSSFIYYGMDWLAFGHIVIAIAFLGALRNPVKNVWVIEFGMIACVLVIPVALIFGQIRGIPFFWRLIDCSFGIVGIVPLWLCRRYIKQVEK
jgi:asparagine N-glycosylation enzyme membrane subunit Stt3